MPFQRHGICSLWPLISWATEIRFGTAVAQAFGDALIEGQPVQDCIAGNLAMFKDNSIKDHWLAGLLNIRPTRANV